MMMMTDWSRCRRSFELVKCRWIWNALQPITWPGNTWCTISLHQQGMSEGIIECSTMVIPVVTALGIFLESAVVQMPRLDYSFQPENILHRVLHWKYILHDGAMHWKKAFNLCSIACQTFFFITWQSFLETSSLKSPRYVWFTKFMILLKKAATEKESNIYISGEILCWNSFIILIFCSHRFESIFNAMEICLRALRFTWASTGGGSTSIVGRGEPIVTETMWPAALYIPSPGMDVKIRLCTQLRGCISRCTFVSRHVWRASDVLWCSSHVTSLQMAAWTWRQNRTTYVFPTMWITELGLRI